MLFVERFALTQMLSSCGLHIGHNDNQCVKDDYDTPGRLRDLAAAGWFLGGCAAHWVGEDDYDGVCFHVSSNLMFTS